MQVPVQSSSTSLIKSSLIEPDGGFLIDLIVPESEREVKTVEAESLPKVRLTKIDVEWLHVISEGWASPLKGFMREDEYLQSLHIFSLRFKDGSFVNKSLPIVLAIDDETKESIGSSSDVGLVRPDGDLIAILRRIQIYKHNKEERIARTWGTTAPGLPYVEEVITPAGNWLIGGDLEVLKPIKYNDGLDHYRLSPKQLRQEFDRRGFTKVDDVPLDVRMEQHSKVLEDGVLDPETTIVAIFPSPMHYAGPTEVQWHAKARINAGANFYIVGRDPAGMGTQRR
ncbi:ATP sulfurylase 4 [Hibiscus syriacus]|uniref:ATP sulfurylase 4 n=1 Tax=Hibiscus syriacus TaxID=106335 RepID=A0A6A3BC02_HIBSY|nr:ATP sulfurylase 4 [Hibiscus syriacus]